MNNATPEFIIIQSFRFLDSTLIIIIDSLSVDFLRTAPWESSYFITYSASVLIHSTNISSFGEYSNTGKKNSTAGKDRITVSDPRKSLKKV